MHHTHERHLDRLHARIDAQQPSAPRPRAQTTRQATLPSYHRHKTADLQYRHRHLAVRHHARHAAPDAEHPPAHHRPQARHAPSRYGKHGTTTRRRRGDQTKARPSAERRSCSHHHRTHVRPAVWKSAPTPRDAVRQMPRHRPPCDHRSRHATGNAALPRCPYPACHQPYTHHPARQCPSMVATVLMTPVTMQS